MSPPISGNAGLHVRYEKAGLILDGLPIPWNADAVIVEANVRLPASAERDKQDFTLRLSTDSPPVNAELIVPPKKPTPMRVFFRSAVPPQSCTASISWREHVLGQIELPILSAADYTERLALEMPTVHVAIGTRIVTCKSFVTTHAKNAFASALIKSSGPLAAAIDLELRVDIERDHGEPVGTEVVVLTAEQLRARQALVMVQLPKLRWVGEYRLAWHVGKRCLHTQIVRTVSRKKFLASLRISATRFVVETAHGKLQTHRTLPPLDGVAAVYPVFYVSSGEAGCAGVVPFTLRALVNDVVTTMAIEEDAIVTDGPTPLMLGKLAASELANVKHFTLASGATILGNLPLIAAPKADFTSEGGFVPLDEYLWSSAAEEQLQDRLGKLLDEE